MKTRYLITIDANVEEPVLESGITDSGARWVSILARTPEETDRVFRATMQLLHGVSQRAPLSQLLQGVRY